MNPGLQYFLIQYGRINSSDADVRFPRTASDGSKRCAVSLDGAAVRAYILVIVGGILQENPFQTPPAQKVEIEVGRFIERYRRDADRECSLCRG
jgi:hypothetical protein